MGGLPVEQVSLISHPAAKTRVSAPEAPPYLGDGYTILSPIGAGGMGRVYLAHDTKHDRRVAIKVLAPHFERVVGPQRFLREIRITAGLTHPRIVPLYDSGEVNGQLFYAMSYVDGESLRQRLDRETMLPVAQALEWGAEVAEGLAFAHAHGVVHRDIKPENLLIHAGHMLIADFGIARAIDLAAGDAITSEQLVLGTPTYMSPEQASAATRLDGRSDVYSLACVVYEMLAGEPPFRGATPQAITAKKQAGHYAPLRLARPTVPLALEQALARALAPVAADRVATAEEFSASLRAAVKPRPGRIFAWLVAAGLVGAAIGLLVTHTPRSERVKAVRQRVAVGIFENRTGEPRYDPLGFMAADWVIEGLQRTGAVDVVPTLTTLAAARFLRDEAGTVDPVRALSRETGANLVVNGSIYRNRDSLVFQAQLVDADAGRLVGAVEPVSIGEAEPVGALDQVRTRLMGLLALSLDDRVLQTEKPPTYAAYQAFSGGMDAYVRNDYRSALAAFERAYAIDTTFVVALLYASFCHSNLGDYASADSLLRIVGAQRNRLSAYDRYWLDYGVAELAGDESKALAAIRGAAELAPTSKATYNFAVQALEARQPAAAESALRRLSPDVGAMRGWFPYWDVLASALHAQRKHVVEVRVAREAHQRFPHSIVAYVLLARALAAERSLAELERLWPQAAAQSDATLIQMGTLAYEVGSELWAHGDSTDAQAWFDRSYNAFGPVDGRSGEIESRWGRAQAAARLGRLVEALELAEALASRDLTRPDYAGLLGVVAAELGNRARAQAILERLAADTRPYTWGRPQFQAGRIAVALGDVREAARFLAIARERAYPYDLELHRDPILAGLRELPALRQLDARPE